MKFDPVRTREITPGAVARALRTEYAAERPMGNVAASELSECIRAWLVGFHSEVAPIVRRSNDWLNRAIEEGEKFGINPDLHRVTLYQAKAIAKWMESGRDDESAWNQARLYEESAWRHESRPWTEKEILQDGLNDFMAFACLGGIQESAVEAGIVMYERWKGAKEISLKKALKPCDFGYVKCLHLARQQFEAEDLLRAGRKMLQAHLEEKWLGAGQYTRAATWLKIVYSDNAGLSPLETVLAAYEDMPGITRPDFA